mgnify:CR=1 FL=1
MPRSGGGVFTLEQLLKNARIAEARPDACCRGRVQAVLPEPRPLPRHRAGPLAVEVHREPGYPVLTAGRSLKRREAMDKPAILTATLVACQLGTGSGGCTRARLSQRMGMVDARGCRSG